MHRKQFLSILLLVLGSRFSEGIDGAIDVRPNGPFFSIDLTKAHGERNVLVLVFLHF